jgi:hypothetical protein
MSTFRVIKRNDKFIVQMLSSMMKMRTPADEAKSEYQVVQDLAEFDNSIEADIYLSYYITV